MSIKLLDRHFRSLEIIKMRPCSIAKTSFRLYCKVLTSVYSTDIFVVIDHTQSLEASYVRTCFYASGEMDLQARILNETLTKFSK